MELILLLSAALPLVLLFLYVILNVFSKKTKTKIDDYAKEIIGELLKGLGKDVPSPVDPKLIDKDDKK